MNWFALVQFHFQIFQKSIIYTAINNLRVVILFHLTVRCDKYSLLILISGFTALTGVKTCHVLIRCSVCLQLTSQGRKTGIASLLYWVEQSPNVLSSSAAKERTKLDGTV